MNGTWQIFISDTTPTSLGNGVRFHYNPTTNELRYRDPENASWISIDFAPYLTKTEASATYLSQVNATSTYLTITAAGNTYLTQTSAANTYLTKTEAQGLYATMDTVGAVYLSKSDAATIYSTINSPTFTGNVSLPSTTTIGNINATEIAYLDGVTSSIQSQLNAKTQYTVISTTIDVQAEKDYHILANTNDAELTVTLPENPEIGDTVYIEDVAESSHRNKIYVNRNGKNIHSKAEDFAINVDGATVVFMYVSETIGWKVI
jgi:hypothetical protein